MMIHRLPTAPPLQLFLELTARCNLSCRHCYVEAGPRRTEALPASRVHTLMTEFAELGGGAVTLSGGEPSLYPGWRSALRYAAHLGLEPTLITNGTLLTAADIDLLLETRSRIAVSIDGGPAVHDSIRGPSTFGKAYALLLRLAQQGGERSVVCFTPTALNLTELPRVAALAQGAGARLYVSLLEDRGRASQRGNFGLCEADKVWLLETLFHLPEAFPGLEVQCSNLRTYLDRLRGAALEAELIDRTLRVRADGEAYLTAYLDAPAFHLGSVLDRTLSFLWTSPKVSEAYAMAVGRLSREPCRSCRIFDTCLGGSAMLALAAPSGQDMNADGYCHAKISLVERQVARA